MSSQEICLYSYTFLLKNYWSDIGSQNHTGFKCTTHQNVSAHCILWPLSHNKVSFYPRFPQLCAPPPTPTPLSLWLSPHCCLCLCVIYTFFLLNPFTFFHSASSTPLPSDNCQCVPCIHVSVSILFIRFHI